MQLAHNKLMGFVSWKLTKATYLESIIKAHVGSKLYVSLHYLLLLLTPQSFYSGQSMPL
jgi:hypothetical protein